jgi:hypothetical protein
MKKLFLIPLLLFGLFAQAGGMALVTQGHLIKRTKRQIIFETETLRYKIRIPKSKNRGQPFELRKISGNFYTLNADVSLIISKSYVKR